jgi:ABC-type transport system involved in cytochrome c biogenesis permease subunit
MVRGVGPWLVALLIAAAGTHGSSVAVRAEGAEKLDWSAWREMPVFDQGRLMPLDTFARSKVLTICGRASPTFLPDGSSPWGPPDSAAAAEHPRSGSAGQLFPDGKPRTFDPAELLFSWLVEPERWGRVPLLWADNKRLRKEVLGLPLRDKQGRRLRYVSVWQFDHTSEIFRRWEQIQQRSEQEGRNFRLAGLDRQLRNLVQAYSVYHQVTFDPGPRGDNPTRFFRRLQQMRETFTTLVGELQRPGETAPGEELTRAVTEVARAIDALRAVAGRPEFSTTDVEPAVAACRRAAVELERQFARQQTSSAAFIAADLVRQARETQLALYDNGSALRLVPALNPGALDAQRLPDDDAQPWLSIQALLYGSEDLLRGYPQREVQEVREAFGRVKGVYLDRRNPQRPEQFSAAMAEFVAAVRTLGEKLSGLRSQLPIRDKDDALLAATAYPPPGSTRIEVFYNRLDPFFWSWLVSLGAVLCLALSFGVIRKPMFWAGIVLLLAAQVLILTGFGVRTYVTRLLPLTGMFETVVFVALCVALLGVWFTLLPLTWPGLSAAWRLTAFPVGRLESPPGEAALSLWGPRWWSVGKWLLLLPRGYLMYWVFIKLARTPQTLSDGYFNLLPKSDIGSSMPTISNLTVWLLGLCVLLLCVYVLPRVILTLLLGIPVSAYALARQGLAGPVQQVFARKSFALVGAAVAFLVALLAYYAPTTVLDKEIGSARPVLRDNFWLFVHVVTITASYGAGAMAWGLSNIALAYYLFGRYRHAGTPGDDSLGEDHPPADQPTMLRMVPVGAQHPAGESSPPPDPKAGTPPVRLAPQPCARLAGFTYKATQVAVLLLAAGTILGALWADVAWGRFWSWDAKEVWSLVTLLVYMLILHGRHIGWFGNFGLAVGSVLGFTSIVMAWYGVNFVLGSGLHSYASGSGGQVYVGIAVLCNWLFLALAAGRYLVETRTVATA